MDNNDKEKILKIKYQILHKWHENIVPKRKDMDDYHNGKEDAYMECIKLIEEYFPPEKDEL